MKAGIEHFLFQISDPKKEFFRSERLTCNRENSYRVLIFIQPSCNCLESRNSHLYLFWIFGGEKYKINESQIPSFPFQKTDLLFHRRSDETLHLAWSYPRCWNFRPRLLWIFSFKNWVPNWLLCSDSVTWLCKLTLRTSVHLYLIDQEIRICFHLVFCRWSKQECVVLF